MDFDFRVNMDLELHDANTLVGAIRREITKETEEILAGLFRTMRVDAREQHYIMQNLANILCKIEDNTSHNVYKRNLEQILNDIASLND